LIVVCHLHFHSHYHHLMIHPIFWQLTAQMSRDPPTSAELSPSVVSDNLLLRSPPLDPS
jgi:hypothetical protein